VRALVLALVLAACSASEGRGAAPFDGGSADPLDHFLQACADLAPTPPDELRSDTGWIEEPQQMAAPDGRTTYLLARKWRQPGVERSNVAWIAEWHTQTPNENFLSYSCTVTFNGPSFEEIDARLKDAGYRYVRVHGAGPGLQGTPRTQAGEWSGRSTLADYVQDASWCEVRLDHGERDPIGAPCTDCRQNILMCFVDSRNLPPSERAEWYARRGIEEAR
jgi:hypothetical protein